MKTINYLTVLLLILNLKLNAQFGIANVDKLEKVKNGITYIAMKDPSSPASKEYIEIFKKYWTYSKFEFIKYSDIKNYISKNSSFFTVSGYETNVQNINVYSNGSSRNGINYSITHLYLELWTCDDKYFEIKNQEFTNEFQREVARIELFTDFQTLSNPNNIYETEYNGEGHIRNWGPGILKNYIQQLMLLLKNGTAKRLYDNVEGKPNLKDLSTQTLYVPDYVLINFNKWTGDESKKNEEKDLFKGYKFNYKLVSINELNNMILDSKPFYYLVYVKSSTDKYLTIINSETGEVLYSNYTYISYNINSKDITKLYKVVSKK
jgi:hypothetical protein